MLQGVRVKSKMVPCIVGSVFLDMDNSEVDVFCLVCQVKTHCLNKYEAHTK